MFTVSPGGAKGKEVIDNKEFGVRLHDDCAVFMEKCEILMLKRFWVHIFIT
jgi:hypothetical protein